MNFYIKHKHQCFTLFIINYPVQARACISLLFFPAQELSHTLQSHLYIPKNAPRQGICCPLGKSSRHW